MPSMKQGGDWISTNSAIPRSGHYHLTVEEARRRDLVGEPLRMITLESRIPCARNLATLLRQSGLSQALDQPDTILLPREGHCRFVKIGNARWRLQSQSARPESESRVEGNSDPQGADAKTSIGWSCRTPCSIELSLDGPFTVTFTRPGFAPRTVPVELEPGQPGEAHAKFAPNPPVRLPPGRPRLSTSELVPTTTIVAVLINPINNPAVVETVSRQAQASARALGLQILQEIACFQASYQLAGSSTRPRSTKLCRQLGCSGSSSPSFGRRRSRVANAISPSIRASWAPRQK